MLLLLSSWFISFSLFDLLSLIYQRAPFGEWFESLHDFYKRITMSCNNYSTLTLELHSRIPPPTSHVALYMHVSYLNQLIHGSKWIWKWPMLNAVKLPPVVLVLLRYWIELGQMWSHNDLDLFPTISVHPYVLVPHGVYRAPGCTLNSHREFFPVSEYHFKDLSVQYCAHRCK